MKSSADPQRNFDVTFFSLMGTANLMGKEKSTDATVYLKFKLKKHDESVRPKW